MTVRTDGFRKFGQQLPVKVRQNLIAIGYRILGQWQRDFNRNARGGGQWAPLAASTMRARRGPSRANKKRGGPRKFSILINTGLLRASLTGGNAGNVFQSLQVGGKYGIRVGIGGNARGLVRKGNQLVPAKATLGQIARWHNDGAGRLPKRIIAQPLNGQTLAACRRLEQAAIAEAGGK